jgi:hypothetical protein
MYESNSRRAAGTRLSRRSSAASADHRARHVIAVFDGVPDRLLSSDIGRDRNAESLNAVDEVAAQPFRGLLGQRRDETAASCCGKALMCSISRNGRRDRKPTRMPRRSGSVENALCQSVPSPARRSSSAAGSPTSCTAKTCGASRSITSLQRGQLGVVGVVRRRTGLAANAKQVLQIPCRDWRLADQVVDERDALHPVDRQPLRSLARLELEPPDECE